MVGPDSEKSIPLCIHCSTKLKQAETARLKTHLQIMEYCDRTMAFQLGITASSAKIQEDVVAGALTLNNINVSHSNIGLLNTGKIQAKSIDLAIDSLIKNNEVTMADTIKFFTEAILQERQIEDSLKGEIIERLGFIAEESTKPPPSRKKSLVLDAIEKISQLISLSDGVKKIWELSFPVIKNFFN